MNKYRVIFQNQAVSESEPFEGVLVSGKTEQEALEQYKDYVTSNSLKARFVVIQFLYKCVKL